MEKTSVEIEEAAPMLTDGSTHIKFINSTPQTPIGNKNGFVSTDELHQRNKHKFQRLKPQLLVAGAAFILAAGIGMPIGYSAVLLPQLQHVNSTLPTDDEIGSWIASVHSAATPFGSFISGFMMDKWGRRRVLQICVIPLALGWVTIAVAQSHVLILAGRVIAGVAVGLSAAPGQVFLGEVAEPGMRGLLTSMPFVSYSFGIFIIYTLGATLHWQTVAWLATILPLLSFMIFTLMPESPVWLVRKNRVREAGESLNWLRGKYDGGVKAKIELQQMVDRVHSERTSHQKSAKASAWNSFCKPQILKPIIIVNVFNLLQIVCGTYLVIFYAVNLISDTNTDTDTVDPFLVAVLTAVCRLVFITAASFLLFWVGRRPLAMFSGLGSSAAALSVGTFIYCRYPISETTDSWIVTGFILAYVATNTIGFFVLPGIAIGEMLPVKVRGCFGGYIFAIFNIALFFMGKVFPSMLNVIGSHGAFWMFGISSVLGTLFLYLFFPETKGKTLEEIEDYFAESNVMWINRKTHQSTNEPIKA